MFEQSTETLTQMGAQITTAEIKQQPDLWLEALANYTKDQEKITAFLAQVADQANGQPVRVVFAGAGSSQYVGDTVTPYLQAHGDRRRFSFESVGTTNIVSAPADYLTPDEPTLLVSFARSGNSPESLKTVTLAEQLVTSLHQISITCAPDGQLAQKAQTEPQTLVLLQPARSNDKGFAMTGSFSCMLLTALLVFDTASLETKQAWVQTIAAMGREVIARESAIQALVDQDFERIVYLGTGSLSGLAREAQLKVLELTAGRYATMFDSSMGFRHGPKSFVNSQTLLFDFVANDAYSRQYDLDLLAEVAGDHIAPVVMAVGTKQKQNFAGSGFYFDHGNSDLPEAYQALPDVMFAQTLALLASVKVGNRPDTPSPTGTVNRVVKGVILHDYPAVR